jgi:NNP family nitrate/nitrite transporter-like MFS transporter
MTKTKNNKIRILPGAYLALTTATLLLAVNFWAWSLLGPLGTRYADQLSLSPLSLSFLLAIPVIIGSLGRIILGVITDKYGGRLIFTIVSLLTAIPVVALGFCTTYNQLLFVALFLGMSGATFVIGVPFISAWFSPERRGFVLGLYSLGNAGTAISGLLTPRLDNVIGRQWAFNVVASILVILALIFYRYVKDAPSWKPPKDSALKQFRIAATTRTTWDLSLLYIITFGAFVAFGVYLPVLLKVAYSLSVTDAASRAAGFILLATIARPFGGWLSDKIGGRTVIKGALLTTIFLSLYVSFQPALHLHTTIAYLSLAFVLGCNNGAVFALLGKLSKPGTMGTVSGIVGALGGLGGFFPPLVLGFTYQRTQSYSLALIMLASCALAGLVYCVFRFRSRPYSQLIVR